MPAKSENRKFSWRRPVAEKKRSPGCRQGRPEGRHDGPRGCHRRRPLGCYRRGKSCPWWAVGCSDSDIVPRRSWRRVRGAVNPDLGLCSTDAKGGGLLFAGGARRTLGKTLRRPFLPTARPGSLWATGANSGGHGSRRSYSDYTERLCRQADAEPNSVGHAPRGCPSAVGSGEPGEDGQAPGDGISRSIEVLL